MGQCSPSSRWIHLVILLTAVIYSQQQSQCHPNGYECSQCQDGWWGDRCQWQCPYGCINTNCDKDHGFCPDGCKARYSYGTEACPCSTCVGGWCDDRSGHCSHGCVNGYYGSKCTTRCPQGRCKHNICDQENGLCTYGCNEGYHGTPDCPCPGHCKDGRCNRDTGHCSAGCDDGYYGDTCSSSCHQICRRCFDYNSGCTACQSGHYGYWCSKQCSNCKHDVCQQNGTCTEGCNDGFYDYKCNSSCSDNCMGNACDKLTGECSKGCKRWYFGATCNTACSWTCLNNACDERTGTCSEGCENGYVGTTCQSKCYTQCIACHKDSENCQLCKVGYYGSSCRSQCPGTCKGKTCKQDTGVCTQGCVDGYYGETCSGQCSDNCKTCGGKSQCNECRVGFYLSNGRCHPCRQECKECTGRSECTRCKEGYYISSNTCERCPTGCKACSGPSNCWSCVDGYYRSGGQCSACREPCTRCTGLTTCSQCGSGHYLRGFSCIQCETPCISCTEHYKCTKCHDGYYLASNKWCVNCSANCLNCQTSNRCSNCKPGHYGRRCERSCPTNCKGSTCDKESGECVVQCEDGFYGQNCDKPCLPGCKTCTGPEACSQCKPGYTGGTCCPQNCTDGQCSPQTGECSLGCRNGTYGEHCQFPCPVNCLSCNQSTGECLICMSGLYGTDCSSQCSDGCASIDGVLLCNVEDGTCTNGCSLQAKRGPQCTEECNAHCVDKKCNQFTGHCNSGCEAGFYGNTCGNECSSNCANSRCFEVNGTCIEGCNGGFRGHDCLEAEAEADIEGGSSSVAAAAGGALVAAVVVIVTVIVITVLIRRRREKPEDVGRENEPGPTDNRRTVHFDASPPAVVIADPDYETPSPSRAVNDNRYNIAHNCPAAEAAMDTDEIVTQADCRWEESTSEHVYYNSGAVTRPVGLDELQAFVAGKPTDEYIEEFQRLPKGLCKPHTVARKPENSTKNRYKEIFPYDDTRVVLKDGQDYINASYIDGFDSPKAYIAALGTIPATVSDFWRMVWQERSGKIVMLTNLVETKVVKCHQYWPSKGKMTQYGQISVTTDAEEVFAEFIVRRFTIVKAKETRKIAQVQYTAWPDKGVPDDVTSLVAFRQKALSTTTTTTSLTGPVVVHCSAGIGRTGTYLALDYLTREGKGNGAVNVFSCVLKLREQRLNMVQTAEQYIYLHKAVVHSLTFSCDSLTSDQLEQYYRRSTKGLPSGKPLLQTQFQHLQETLEAKENDAKSIAKNRTLTSKNRPNSAIAADRCRPRLFLGMKHGDLDYINAVYINSYKTKNGIIVTQTPLSDTIMDFWKLVIQEQASCIVMMEDGDCEKQDVGEYWPTDGDRVCFGAFNIQQTSLEKNDSFTKTTFKVSMKEKGGKRQHAVTKFQFHGWARAARVPTSSQPLLHLIPAVARQCASSATGGPVIVHCLDGAECCGLYCVVSVLVEMMQVEHEVSVVNVVRQMKCRRPQFIPNYEQYKFCHQALDAFLQSFDTYSNFALR